MIQRMHCDSGSNILGLLTETTSACTIGIAIQSMQEYILVLTDDV
jgi:hypothetical protein